MNGGTDSLTCVKTSWNGTLPSCSAVDRMDEPSNDGDGGGGNAAPRLGEQIFFVILLAQELLDTNSMFCFCLGHFC